MLGRTIGWKSGDRSCPDGLTDRQGVKVLMSTEIGFLICDGKTMLAFVFKLSAWRTSDTSVLANRSRNELSCFRWALSVCEVVLSPLEACAYPGGPASPIPIAHTTGNDRDCQGKE